jgi:hypothetical protein
VVVRFRVVEVWLFDGVGVVGVLVPRRPRPLRVVFGAETCGAISISFCWW